MNEPLLTLTQSVKARHTLNFYVPRNAAGLHKCLHDCGVSNFFLIHIHGGDLGDYIFYIPFLEFWRNGLLMDTAYPESKARLFHQCVVHTTSNVGQRVRLGASHFTQFAWTFLQDCPSASAIEAHCSNLPLDTSNFEGSLGMLGAELSLQKGNYVVLVLHHGLIREFFKRPENTRSTERISKLGRTIRYCSTSLLDWNFEFWGIPRGARGDLFGYLRSDKKIPRNKRIIFNRTARCWYPENDNLYAYALNVLQGRGYDCVFVGTDEEYTQFIRALPNTTAKPWKLQLGAYKDTLDFMSSSLGFVGNQSFPASLANALDLPTILEVDEENDTACPGFEYGQQSPKLNRVLGPEDNAGAISKLVCDLERE